MFENWLQEQEASWDYIKNTPSSVLKPDGKTYYKMYEDNKFYPYYFKNSDGISFSDKYQLFLSTKTDDHVILQEFRLEKRRLMF